MSRYVGKITFTVGVDLAGNPEVTFNREAVSEVADAFKNLSPEEQERLQDRIKLAAVNVGMFFAGILTPGKDVRSVHNVEHRPAVQVPPRLS